ncbi:MAG: DUF2304 domain-containing protein [Eubacterium sp.]|nr:DUF2304 domain-containing protein [Eubacterium sp.]
MSFRLQIVVIVAMALALIYLIRQIFRKKLDIKYGIIWLGMSILIMVFAIWPNLLGRLSDLMGIASPVNMLFFIGLVLQMAAIYVLSRNVGVLLDKVRRMSQEIAILNKKLNDNYVKNNKEEE